MSAPPPSPAVTEIAAPVLLGVIGDWTLYGTLVVQLYSYSYNFPEDRKTFKLLVYAISSLETLRTTLSGVDMYYKFASGFGSMDRLSDPYMFVFQVSIIGAVISMAVQYFFAYRVWMLSNKTSFWLCTIICTCSTVNATAELTWGVYAHVLKRFRNGWQLKVFSLTWLIGNTVTNTMITTAMLYHLTRQLSYEGGSIFGHSLTKIMGLTIESNVLTFTSGIIALLMIAIFPDKMWYTFPAAILGKLYSNTLLVSLNNRVSTIEVSSARVMFPKPPLLPVLPMIEPSGIVHVRLENPSYASKRRMESKEEGNGERIIDISGNGL